MEIGYASIGNQEVDVFRGRELIYPYVTDFVTRQIQADGGTVDPVFNTEYQALPELIRREAEAVLVPGAYKTGRIYGVNPITGAYIPFTFARNGVATYFDKDGIMQTAPANVPRIDYDPVTKVCRGYLQEAAATNLLTYSGFTNGVEGITTSAGDFTAVNTLFNKGVSLDKGISITHNPAVAKAASKNLNGGLVNTAYTFSFFVRKSDGTIPKITLSSSDVTTDFCVQLFGTLAIPTSIDHIGNGVYRVILTRTSPSTIVSTSFGLIKYTGNSTVGIVFTGFHVEIGSSISSYIETTGSQVTRPADTLQSLNDISPYNEASVFMNMAPFAVDNNAVSTIVKKYVYGGTTVPSIWYRYTVGGTCRFQPYVSTINRDSYVANGQLSKVLASWSTVGSFLCANGSPLSKRLVNESTYMNNGQPISITSNGSSFIRNYIKSLAIIPRQLSDQEHISITA